MAPGPDIAKQKTSWKVPVLIAVLAALAFMIYVLNTHGWDPHAFILKRSPDVSADQTWGIGYDSQFYYLIAEDPFGSFSKMDLTSLRYQRIFFPLLVRGVSFGNPLWIPWMMLVVNLGAVGLGVYALSRLITARGGRAWVACIWIVSIGYLLALRLALLEPLAMALSFWGWWRWENGRFKSAVLLFALAGLTKEVGMVVPAVISVWEVFNRRWPRGSLLLAGTVLPYLGWAVILDRLIRAAGLPDGHLQLELPFVGFFSNQDPASRALMVIWVILPFILSVILAARDGFRAGWTSRLGLDSMIIAGNVGFMSILPASTWFDPIAVFRTTIGGVAVILLWAAAYHPRGLPWLFGLWLPSGIILFLAGIV